MCRIFSGRPTRWLKAGNFLRRPCSRFAAEASRLALPRPRDRRTRMNRRSSARAVDAATGQSRRRRYGKRWSRPVSRVLYALRRDSHSSRPGVAAWLQQPTREQRGPRYRSPIWSCSEWGLPCRTALAPYAVRSCRTLSPLPDPLARPSAVCSLLHWPSAHAAQELPGTLPCGARTFLDALARDATARPTPWPVYSVGMGRGASDGHCRRSTRHPMVLSASAGRSPTRSVGIVRLYFELTCAGQMLILDTLQRGGVTFLNRG